MSHFWSAVFLTEGGKGGLTVSDFPGWVTPQGREMISVCVKFKGNENRTSKSTLTHVYGHMMMGRRRNPIKSAVLAAGKDGREREREREREKERGLCQCVESEKRACRSFFLRNLVRVELCTERGVSPSNGQILPGVLILGTSCPSESNQHKRLGAALAVGLSGEPDWCSGKALDRLVGRGTLLRIRIHSALSSKVLVYGHWCLSLRIKDFNITMAQLPISEPVWF